MHPRQGSGCMQEATQAPALPGPDYQGAAACKWQPLTLQGQNPHVPWFLIESPKAVHLAAGFAPRNAETQKLLSTVYRLLKMLFTKDNLRLCSLNMS